MSTTSRGDIANRDHGASVPQPRRCDPCAPGERHRVDAVYPELTQITSDVAAAEVAEGVQRYNDRAAVPGLSGRSATSIYTEYVLHCLCAVGRPRMTNLTLSVDEDTLRKARIKALEQGTSVNALVREYLKQLAGRSAAAEGVTEFFAATKGAGAGSGTEGRSWSRAELYER